MLVLVVFAIVGAGLIGSSFISSVGMDVGSELGSGLGLDSSCSPCSGVPLGIVLDTVGCTSYTYVSFSIVSFSPLS